MSAINCIHSENTINPFYEEISSEEREKIEVKINEGKGNELDNSWLNVILDNIPNEIEQSNTYFLYISSIK